MGVAAVLIKSADIFINRFSTELAAAVGDGQDLMAAILNRACLMSVYMSGVCGNDALVKLQN